MPLLSIIKEKDIKQRNDKIKSININDINGDSFAEKNSKYVITNE